MEGEKSMTNNYDLPIQPSLNGMFFPPDSDHSFVGDRYIHGTTAVSGLVIMNLACLLSGSIWGLSDADVPAQTDTLLGFVCATVNSGDSVNIVLPPAMARDDSWAWVAGQPIYVGTALGAVTSTVVTGSGDCKRKIGYAYNADNIYFEGYGEVVVLGSA